MKRPAIRVELPFHLQTLARTARSIEVGPPADATLGSVLDAVEAAYPMLRGTIRDHGTLKRRPFLRFFACGRDLSDADPSTPLPDAVSRGEAPLLIIGAIAGG